MMALISVLAALALAATGVVGSVPAASAAVKTAAHPAARAAVKPDNKVTTPGAMADLATARRDHQKVEVATDRTAFSQTFANPNRTLTTSVSQRPRWVRRGTSWVTASADLTRNASGSWSPKAAQAGLQLSGGGNKTLATLTVGGRTMSLSWPSVLPAPQVNGTQATYASVFPGVDLVITAQVSGGFTETLVVHNAAAARDPQLRNLTLGVSLSRGLTQKAGKDGAVTVQTAGGKAVFSSPAPVAWDSARPAGSAAVSTVAGPGRGAHVAKVSASYGSGSVTTSIPSSLAGAPAVYPVFVDPSYSQTQAWEGYGELQSAYPATNELNSTYDGNVSVGYDGAGVDRGNYVFGLPPLPTGLTATVTSATITGEVVATQTSASESHTINAYYTSQYTSASTWNSPPSQLAGPVGATFMTSSTAPDLNVSWTVTSWLQTALNNGSFEVSAELINANESSNLLFAEFGPDPTLTYTYSQPAPSIPLGSGPVMNATQLKFPVSDKVALQVNVGSGNALVTTSDIALPEQGSSLTLGVAYNSLLTGSQVMTGSDGVGWRQRQGADVRLYLGADGSLTYLGEDGTAGKFTAGSGSSFVSPPQFHATLATSATACGGTGYTMTWRRTGQVMCFNANGLLTSQADRNGNTTAYSYNASSQETQITYTPKGASSANETVTATYSGSYLNTLSESGGSLGTRTVTYTVNGSGDLQSVKQADGTLVQFGYDSSHNLTSIENGASVTTHLYYDSSHRVTSVGQVYGSCGCTATTRLSYVSATETQVADPNTNQSQAVSAVPNTTYTLNAQDLVTKTVDQQNNTFTASYNSQDDQTGSSNADGGSTVNTWTAGANGIDENLTASQSAMGATTKAAYANANTGTNPTAEYQPSSSTDAQNNATAYTYDGAGNLQQSADALPATAKVTYNSDGTAATSTDPKNGTNTTSYTYNALHQLTKVTPPTGNTLAAESLTYDGYGRTATITDGDGNTVTYTYDNADRITKQAYTGGTHTVTVSYVYDGAGNLKTQTDPSGTTSYTYDGRNKVLTKNAASGGGTLAYDYDADSNLAKVTDAGGPTSYGYDTRNLLSSLTDPAGNLWQFAYNADGLRTTTWFATNTGNTTWAEEMVTSYDKGDRITRIQTYRASSASNVVSDTSYCDSAYVSGQACPTASASTDKALLQWSENNQTSTISQYTYDTGNRLKTATNYGGTSYTYGYDTDGNLTSGGTAGTQTFNSANQSTVSGYTYDGTGNQATTPGNGTFTYNDAEQWTGASATGESLTYAGAGQNQILSDGSAAGITYGLAGQAGQAWIQSYTPTSSATDYVIHDQQGTPLGYLQGGTAYGFATDNLGSVTNVVASNGTTVGTYAYTPYGHLNSVTGTDGNQNLLRYTGALYDTTSNYWHLGARWNNAYTNNFTTQDTSSYLDNPENGNRYAYASDNPTNYTDPTGQSWWNPFSWSTGTWSCIGAGFAFVSAGLLYASSLVTFVSSAADGPLGVAGGLALAGAGTGAIAGGIGLGLSCPL